MLSTIDTLPEFTGLTLVLGLITVVAIAILIALDNERNRRARHRARTSALLLHIRLMPYVTQAPTSVAAGRR